MTTSANRWPSAKALYPLAALLAGCVSEPSPVTGRAQSYAYTWEEERRLGADADKGVVGEMGLYSDRAVQQYVADLGEKLLRESDLRTASAPQNYRDTPFTFRVLNSPVVNAFAIPGGYVYVTRGLLAHVENEAQLAMILGHEIGHIAARHTSQQARRAQWSQLGLIAGAIVGNAVIGSGGEEVMSTLLNAGGQAAQMFLLKYDRGSESEADRLGARYARDAGYSIAESADFFRSLERIQAEEGKSIPDWASTHPDPGDRAKGVIAMGRVTPGGDVATDFYLRRLEGLIIGDDPREGFVESDIFHHPGLKLQFPVPRNWTLKNDTTAVLIAEPRKRALLSFRLAPGSSARLAANEFSRKSGILVQGVTDTQLGGHEVALVVGQSRTSQGEIAVWSAFVEMDGRVFNFQGISAPEYYSAARSVFADLISGMEPLRDARILAVQPARLTIVPANRAAPFQEFLPAKLPKGITAEHLAIMNQVGLGEAIPIGRLLKLPSPR